MNAINTAARVLGVSAMFAAGASYAECTDYYCDGARILGITTPKQGDVFVKITGTVANLNCTLHGGVYLTLEGSAPRFKDIYASLLAAQHAGTTLMFRIDIGSTGCTINYIHTT